MSPYNKQDKPTRMGGEVTTWSRLMWGWTSAIKRTGLCMRICVYCLDLPQDLKPTVHATGGWTRPAFTTRRDLHFELALRFREKHSRRPVTGATRHFRVAPGVRSSTSTCSTSTWGCGGYYGCFWSAKERYYRSQARYYRFLGGASNLIAIQRRLEATCSVAIAKNQFTVWPKDLNRPYVGRRPPHNSPRFNIRSRPDVRCPKL
jgi:hypothetical protein